MKCPACSNMLRQVNCAGDWVDVCPGCKGIWFDSGELKSFVHGLIQSKDISPEELKLFQRKKVFALHEVNEQDRICPKCNKKLGKFNYSYDSNVFLDKCSDCGGIWADAGEAKNIARYIKEDPKATEAYKALVGMIYAMEMPETSADEMGRMAARLFLFFPKVVVPVGTDAPVSKIPIVTISIMLCCALFFIWRILSDPGSLVEVLNIIPEKSLNSIDLLSSIFIIGSLLHLIWDMLFLWLFGSSTEDRFGRRKYLMFFVFCGVFSGLLYSFFHWDLSVFTVAVSGSVSGITAAYFVFYPMSKIRVFVIYKIAEIPALVCLGIWFLFLLAGPFLPIVDGAVKSAWFVSIVGSLAGFTTAWFVKD